MKPSTGQNEFDFDRGERLALLDALVIPSGDVRDGSATVRASGATSLSVLRAIEAHGRHTGQCWASAVTIGREINRHERTVRRAITYLESLEFLIVDRPVGQSPRCRINWGEISLVTSRNENREPKKATTPTKLATRNSQLATRSNPGHSDTNPGHSDTNPGHCVRRSVSKRKRSLPPPSPTAGDGPRHGRHASAAPRESWQEVEAVLCGLLGDWTRALRDARSNGVGPRHVLAIVDHFHALGDRVSPGALYWRLRRAHPSLAPQDGWPVQMTKRPAVHSRPTPSGIYGRVVRAGRKRRASADEIRADLARELVAAGYAPDAETFS